MNGGIIADTPALSPAFPSVECSDLLNVSFILVVMRMAMIVMITIIIVMTITMLITTIMNV